MKLRFEPRTSLVFGLVFFGIIGGIAIFLNHSSFETFTINDFVEPNQLKTGDRIVVDVKCFLSARTLFEDGQGNIVAQSDGSQFLKENPRFDLTAWVRGTSTKILFIHPTLSAKCQMPTLISADGKNTLYPLAIEKDSVVKYRIVSQSSAKEPQPKIVTWVKDTKIPKDVYLFHDTQTVIYEDLIPIDEILKRLEDGEYDSFQQVDWTGYLQMHLHDPNNPTRFLNAKWYIDFLEGSNSNNVESINELTTWLEIFVDKEIKSQTPNVGGSQLQNPPEQCTENCVPVTELSGVEEWFVCATTANSDCLMNTKYYMSYLILGGIIFAGLLFSRNKDGS